MLKKIDAKVIKSIGVGHLSAVQIANKIGCGKTTVQYSLQKLFAARLVNRSNGRGREILYSLNKKTVNEARESRLIEVYSGKNLLQAYNSFLKLPKHSTIYSIQGLGAVNSIFKVLPADFIKKVHASYRRKGIILKGFSNERILGPINSIPKGMLESHIGRATGLKLIAGGDFLGPCEVFSTKYFLFLCNVSKKRALVIKDKDIAGLIHEVLRVSYESFEGTKTFDLNEYFRQRLPQY